ncbi:hypothetical protein CPB85DRAFT_1257934 [Mucidula mucida]|nr:hypothetical protein CPB85DRAFT_1257934 [Mucidula mucida]
MSYQAWWCWLEFCELELEDVEGTSVAARRHQQWKQEIDGMSKAAAAEIAIKLPAVETWRGRVPNPTMEKWQYNVWEILWEMNKFAFWLELVCLCMHLCWPETLQSQIFWDSICCCFPLGDASLGFVDPGHAN